VVRQVPRSLVVLASVHEYTELVLVQAYTCKQVEKELQRAKEEEEKLKKELEKQRQAELHRQRQVWGDHEDDGNDDIRQW